MAEALRVLQASVSESRLLVQSLDLAASQTARANAVDSPGALRVSEHERFARALAQAQARNAEQLREVAQTRQFLERLDEAAQRAARAHAGGDSDWDADAAVSPSPIHALAETHRQAFERAARRLRRDIAAGGSVQRAAAPPSPSVLVPFWPPTPHAPTP